MTKRQPDFAAFLAKVLEPVQIPLEGPTVITATWGTTAEGVSFGDVVYRDEDGKIRRAKWQGPPIREVKK